MSINAAGNQTNIKLHDMKHLQQNQQMQAIERKLNRGKKKHFSTSQNGTRFFFHSEMKLQKKKKNKKMFRLPTVCNFSPCLHHQHSWLNRAASFIYGRGCCHFQKWQHCWCTFQHSTLKGRHVSNTQVFEIGEHDIAVWWRDNDIKLLKEPTF